jgi:hypothetical protein
MDYFVIGLLIDIMAFTVRPVVDAAQLVRPAGSELSLN